MANSYSIVRNAYSRVFVIEGRARADHIPEYNSCLRMLGISQNFGDITRVECPDPDNYGKFIEVASIRGASERATTSLEGRYALELKSTLLRLARKGCAVDVQLHIGECTDPSDFDTFKKALVLENVLFTTYSTDELGALTSDDNAAVNETVEISAEDVYEALPLTFQRQADSLITNEVVDVVYGDSVSCGECEVESDGCQKVFALTKAAGGSPTTPADIVFSLNAGGTWYAHDVDTLGAAEEPSALDAVGDYMVVVSQATESLHYALKSEFNSYTDPAFTEVTTGFVAAHGPNDIFSTGRQAFIVGEGGYVYETTDPTAGVSVLDAGSATTDDLNRVHALSSQNAVAVGNSGTVVYTENGTNWGAVTNRPTGAGVHLTAVCMRSKSEWWVGTDTGAVYYTLDKGVTWTAVTFSGSGAGRVDDIVFATNSIGYIAHAAATPRGRILRTYNGGQTWSIMPESGTLPLCDRVNRLATCGDPNIVVGGGLADDGADGYLVMGLAS